eukprot:TRINITY_DN4824_c1_g1_i1.p2 TRINITY_DN4824_c1_g1~~TRINITY_DN4824_c1_g1_i1.p2  ORF type:complete len:137 (+),score=44.50 TRINITY_DN4824_c1_g1_i1:63-473(+)
MGGEENVSVQIELTSLTTSSGFANGDRSHTPSTHDEHAGLITEPRRVAQPLFPELGPPLKPPLSERLLKLCKYCRPKRAATAGTVRESVDTYFDSRLSPLQVCGRLLVVLSVVMLGVALYFMFKGGLIQFKSRWDD